MDILEHSFTVRCATPHVPPRCRNPRVMVEKCQIIARMSSYQEDEAPVAFKARISGKDAEFRIIEGKIYSRDINAEGKDWEKYVVKCVKGESWLLKGGEMWDGWYEKYTQESTQGKADRILESLVLVNGEVWRESGMPLYRLYSFGDGSCSLGVVEKEGRWLTEECKGDWEYASNFFSPDHFEDACKAAMEISANCVCEEKIEVLDPNAVMFDPQEMAARMRLDSAKRCYEEAMLALEKAKEELESAEKCMSGFEADSGFEGEIRAYRDEWEGGGR